MVQPRHCHGTGAAVMSHTALQGGHVFSHSKQQAALQVWVLAWAASGSDIIV